VAAAPLAERIGAADRPAHTLHGALFVVVSLAIAFVAPVSAMTLGPLLLGAPHLVGDLRVLWLQRPGGILDAEILRIFVPLLAMTLVRPALAIGFPEPAMCEVALGVVHLGKFAERHAVTDGHRMKADEAGGARHDGTFDAHAVDRVNAIEDDKFFLGESGRFEGDA
jgi:hypothetical protein